MKNATLLFLSLFFLIPMDSNAQILKKIKKTAEQAAENAVLRKTRQKTEEAVEETIEGVLEGEKDEKEGSEALPGGDDNSTATNEEGENSSDSSQPQSDSEDDGLPAGHSDMSGEVVEEKVSLESYSKYDFIPGERILQFENFERSEVADFPTGWNTMGGAEVVTLNTVEGKWLKLGNNTGGIIPYQFDQFPENFTMEFDMVFDHKNDYAFKRSLYCSFSAEGDPEVDVNDIEFSDNQLIFRIYGGVSNHKSNADFKKRKNRSNSKGNKVNISKHLGAHNIGKVIHVAFWRQGSRMRMYIDEQKIYDIPLAWNMEEAIAGFRFNSAISREDEFFYVSNLRLAVGKADTRSKLITEGKLITYGITFETNSSDVKPSSYGTLKSIANVLKENPDVKVQISGHTDGDGSDDYNLKLSGERAASVKAALVGSFGISSDRFTTVGKGESEPIGDNNTPEGKAQNRRVEFIKL